MLGSRNNRGVELELVILFFSFFKVRLAYSNHFDTVLVGVRRGAIWLWALIRSKLTFLGCLSEAVILEQEQYKFTIARTNGTMKLLLYFHKLKRKTTLVNANLYKGKFQCLRKHRSSTTFATEP